MMIDYKRMKLICHNTQSKRLVVRDEYARFFWCANWITYKQVEEQADCESDMSQRLQEVIKYLEENKSDGKYQQQKRSEEN